MRSGEFSKLRAGVPGAIGVVEAGPLDSILDLVPVASGVEDFLYFPLLLFLDDYRRGWRLEVARDRFGAGCGFEEADVEDWVDFDSGQEIQLIGACAHFLEDGVWPICLWSSLFEGRVVRMYFRRSQTLSSGSSAGSGCRALLDCSASAICASLISARSSS